MTEEEQLEKIKDWWKKYNNIITLVGSIILLSIFGYKYWLWQQNKISIAASNTYEHMMVALSHQNNNEVRSYANLLIQNYPKTMYANIAYLILAKLYVGMHNYKIAQQNLEQVIKNSKLLALRQVAKIRLARLYIAEKNYNAALATLSEIDNSTYIPVINELKGDINIALGHYKQGLEFYENAINTAQQHGIANIFLEMKAHELTAQTNTAQDKV